MSSWRRWRYIYHVVTEISRKYTSALIFGLFLGVGIFFFIAHVYPLVIQLFFTPVTRIALVGDYTPSNLPLVIQQKISSGLTEIAPDGSAQKALAQSWEINDDGKQYVFHLSRDYHWHTGKPVEARDVNYNIRDVTFSVVNPETLVATLSQAYSPFPTLVAKPIIQAGLMGFGPYKVSTIHLKGDSISFMRLTPVDLKNKQIIEYRFYKTETQAITAYKLGEVNEIDDLSTLNDFNSWKQTKITPVIRTDRIVSLYFNESGDKVLSEKSFRQGLGYSIETPSEDLALSPISKTSWAYSDNVKRYTYDPLNAKKLLKATPLATSSAYFVLSTFSTYEPLAEHIAKNWTDNGVPTIVKVENSIPSDYQILLAEQNIPPDPDQYPFWHSTQTQTNITGYVNVKIDKLLEDGRRETDMTKRKKIYEDFARRITEDAPVLFLYYPKTYTISRTK